MTRGPASTMLLALATGALAVLVQAPGPDARAAAAFNVGAARVDITGPFVQASTGHSSPGDEMSGLAMRLYSRAFVIEDPDAGRAVALATADMLHMNQSVKLGVVKKLAADGYGSVFRTDNVLVTGTPARRGPSPSSEPGSRVPSPFACDSRKTVTKRRKVQPLAREASRRRTGP